MPSKNGWQKITPEHGIKPFSITKDEAEVLFSVAFDFFASTLEIRWKWGYAFNIQGEKEFHFQTVSQVWI